MNVGRCLRRKWLNRGIMSATIFTNVGILIIDMTLSHSGYALSELHPILFCSVPSPFWWIVCWIGWIVLSGAEERLLVALYCYQAFKGIHSKAFTWCRWSYFSGGWGSEMLTNYKIQIYFINVWLSLTFLQIICWIKNIIKHVCIAIKMTFHLLLYMFLLNN